MELTPELEQVITTKITEVMDGAKQSILADVHRANQGLAASLTKEIKKATEPDEPAGEAEAEQPKEGKLTLKALQQEISGLRQQLADKEQAAFEADSSRALTQAIASAKATNPTALYKILRAEYSGRLKSEGDAWFLTDGDEVKPLGDAIKAYLATEEGKYFVPSSGVNGSDSQETAPATVPNSGEIDTTEALSAAFANL